MDSLLLGAVLGIGLIVGFVVGFVLSRRLLMPSTDASIKAAVADATGDLRTALAIAEEQRRQQETAAEREMARVAQLREEFEARFRVLATEVLDTTARRFTEQNEAALGPLLEPLRMRLADFQRRVEQAYADENEKRLSLKVQVEQLMQLNQTLSSDARNLTEALRGSNKNQGNWGEAILERILEVAGLVRDVHYDVQDSQRNADGQRVQPDVVIRLPEDRRLIIDSKVSLLAFEEACNADGDAEREAATRRHIQSLRTHLRGLSAKQYETAYDQSIDFVIIFVPVEPAFLMAVTGDPTLPEEAWRQNVLLVSPSTLLFVLRTVAFLWRQSQQQRNTRDIVERGTRLYEKLAGFVEDFEGIGAKLQGAHDSYEAALRKLSTGNGNLLRQARQLEALGIKPPKRMPKSLAGTDEETDDSFEDLDTPVREPLPRQLPNLPQS